MKLLSYIIGISLFCLLAGLLVLRYFGWSESGAVSADQFDILLREQVRGKSAKFRVESYFNLPDKDQERLSLDRFLPDTSGYDHKDIASLALYAETCSATYMHDFKDLRLKKTFLFERILCESSAIPENFFETPPYMHPFGGSFVARAHQKKPQFFDLAWVTIQKQYLHVLELQKIYPGDSGSFGMLAPLNLQQRRLWVKGAPVIVVGENIWTLNEHADERMPVDTHYLAFDLSSVNSALHRKGLELVEGNPGNCLILNADFCVRSDRLGTKSRFWAFRVIFISSVMSSVCLLALLILWSMSRGRARKERMMILQTLAHELRTPVTSIGLSLELMRGEYARLSESGQSSYFRIVDDVRRLKRLIEGSRAYLTADSTQRYVKESINLNAFLQRFVDGYEGKVTFMPFSKDITVISHPYWLGICLANLVENALNHGKPEVRISIGEGPRHSSIVVEDGGDFKKSEYLDLKGEFVRGTTSNGMGLGLSIVTDTLRKLGHQLEFIELPTRFVITIKGS